MSRESRRAAFGRCPETCPAVDKARNEALDKIMDNISGYITDGEERHVEAEVRFYLDRFCDTVKSEGTEKLRDALSECEEERSALEDKLSEAEDKISDLQYKVTTLEEKIEYLQGEVTALEGST